MRTLFLIAPSSTKNQTDFQSDRDDKMTGSSLVGTVLASRYKILEMVDVDSFKAHDLALDQPVTVRQALLTSQRAGDTWRQKVQQLALVRDPNFLNVLDVISEKSSDFVITEHARGHSIADLLRERSRLDLQDVMRLVTVLAGSIELAAAYSCCPNAISTCWLFTETRSSLALDREQRSLSDWPMLTVKLDVWELVRPRKNNTWLFLSSKAQRGGLRRLAVRQTALLTYELLGGEKKKEGYVKLWFKPVDGLGNAGNSILYRGLRGSPLFESSECFFQKLKSAIQSGDGDSRALPAPALATQENSVSLPDTADVMRRFNRDTGWLATGVLSVVVFATLVLAFQVQERHPKADDLTEGAKQAEHDLLLNVNPATRFTLVGLTEKSSTDKTTSKQASSVGHAFTEISAQENPSSQVEAAGSTPTPVLALTPEINHHDVQANAGSWTRAIGQDSGRVIGLKVPRSRFRSSVRVDVKMRLIALWHQSLSRSERSRSWSFFANSNKGTRKKVSYTAETNH
jgi:hypothetical protein